MNEIPQKSESVRRRRRAVFYGVSVLIVLSLLVVAYFDQMAVFVRRIGQIIAPLIIGGAIAYICNPILKFYERFVLKFIKKKSIRRGVGLFLTLLTVIGILALIVMMIVPQLINSITQLVNNYEFYLNGLLAFVQNVINTVTAHFDVDIDISNVENLKLFLEDMFGSLDEAINQILIKLKDLFLNGNMISNMWDGLLSVINTFKNIFLGLFIAIYLLASKEKRLAQLRKFRHSILSDKQDHTITHVTQTIDRTFGGFIKGLFLDALAVGVIMFIALSIFRVSEYNLLIATICAITNIIPIFGPFIGAIPSALIVLISNPTKFIVFIIIVIVVQQIDGNIICPKIQGDNTGISSLAVLIAIMVMGSLWGMLGMIIGVPIFAVIIALFKEWIESRLATKGAPVDTSAYYPSDAAANAERELHYEHAPLRYRYEKSKLKVTVDKLRAKFRRKVKKADLHCRRKIRDVRRSKFKGHTFTKTAVTAQKKPVETRNDPKNPAEKPEEHQPANGPDDPGRTDTKNPPDAKNPPDHKDPPDPDTTV